MGGQHQERGESSVGAELPRLTGEIVPRMVTGACRERLEQEVLVEERVEALRAIGKRCASLLGEGPSSVDHGDFLYDDHGLPK